MHPTQREERASVNWHSASHGALSSAGPQRRNDESWVEISSQPSSSSLSSIGDEIVTTGLRVGNPPTARRRRVQPPGPRSYHVDQAAIQGGTSSQEEYEETESEEDRLLSSSNENVQQPIRQSFQRPAQSASEDSDDDYDNATALGRVSDDPVFRPHPNAFSHPPGLGSRRHSTNTSMPSHPHSRVRPALSQRSQTRVSRGPGHFMSPSYQADHDEALRTSLTTLLSCAAAARGLPKYKDAEQQGAPPTLAGVGPSTRPVELRLMPEAELMAPTPVPEPIPRAKSPARSRAATTTSPSPGDGVDKHKRSASSQTRSARVSKKKKVAIDDGTTTLMSPTLLTWVMSAGVVVLVSVVGFGAGYVMGREVGRQEAFASAGAGVNASSVAADSSSCGREVIRSSGGLRRLRWGASVVASS
ncbi:hypothetical protein D7B24_002702 [Verticillium nonalfalfae]|uniref:Uncharacterized protein n=1 Tax=Verticillium nonalfalfae TaxID=1051616 RepID=A0A3M9YG09_9PEZI|nr:uncharacterized protein D7B24_002702 [Verticillium nonalfalfae]RNJ59324.1 hypothetical protein D7B24_002702 [Verticillium nonalfalfae]